jgi:hypothetical protein
MDTASAKHSSTSSLAAKVDGGVETQETQFDNIDIEKQTVNAEIEKQNTENLCLHEITSHATNSHGMPPLDPFAEKGDEIYQRFSPRRKRIMTAVLSFTAVLAPVSSTTVLSAVPEVAAEFSTSGDVVNLSNALYLVFMGLSRKWTLLDGLYSCVSFILGSHRTSIR